MAKRVRGSRSAHRPGGQGPSRSKKPAADAPPDELVETADDEAVLDADYGEVEVDEAAVAAITATPAPQSRPEPRRARRRERRRGTKQRSDDLAMRVAAETVWVREDLRRIGVVSIILLIALAVCWVVFGMLDVLNLY